MVDLTKKADETIQTALEEYHDLEAIISILWAHPADAKATCVFAYVAAFELVGRNADLADDNNAHLSVFAVEFAAALAIFHETMIPRVLMGWLSDWENITRADEANAKDASSFTGTAVREIARNQQLQSPTTLHRALKLLPHQVVLTTIENNRTLDVVTKTTNRFGKIRAEKVLIAPPAEDAVP